MLIFVYLLPSIQISNLWRFFKVTLKALENNGHLREINKKILAAMMHIAWSNSHELHHVDKNIFIAFLKFEIKSEWE